MIIDIIIGILAVLIVAFTILKQIKLYKENGISSLCGGDCGSCSRNCSKNKN